MKKLFIIFAVLCLAAPAMAADWNFYGSSRMATFYSIIDKDIEGDNDTINRTLWDMQGNSRIGANVKVNDQIGGGFEYGHSSAANNVGLRKLFGTYTFGGGSQLLVGQTYTPLGAMFYSNSVFDGDGDLLGVGQFYGQRRPMLQWKTGGLKLAAIKANIPADVPNVSATDLIIPKLEANYNFKGDAFFMDIGGGFQTFGIDNFVGNDPDVTSYVFNLGGGMNFGAFYFSLGGHVGQNLGDYGAYGANLAGIRAIDDDSAQVNQDTVDNQGFGALAVLGFNVSDSFTIETGWGYEYAELDVDGPLGDGESVWQAYINSTINIAPGFFVVPEIGYAVYDYAVAAGQVDPKPNILYVGAKWQINF